MAVLTLALGIGANTAVWTLLNSLFWRSLPVRQPDQIVRVSVTNLPPDERAWSNGRAVPPAERRHIPFPLFTALQEQRQIFEGVFGMGGNGPMVFELAGVPHRVFSATVTGGYFPVLGVKPQIGRLLGPEEDGPARI